MDIRERNCLLDNAKGLLIFLVVFGHTLELFKDKFILAKSIYIFIYFFHMPVFVFISGYFSKNIEKSRETAVTSLLIPFIVFSIPWNIVSLFSGKLNFFSFFTPGWALWYLFSMFIWRSFLPDIIRIRNIFRVSIVVGILAGQFMEFGTFMSLSRTLVFLPYFLAGYYINEEKLLSLKMRRKLLAVLVIAVAIALSIYISISNVMPVEFLWADRTYPYFYTGVLLPMGIRAGLYLIGFSFIYVIIRLMTSKECFLSKIGRNTLPVYILHTYLVGIVIGINKFVPNYYGNLAVSFVGAFLITYLLSRDVVSVKFGEVMGKLIDKIMVKK